MKVGDLVIVIGTSPEHLCTGVIVSTKPPPESNFQRYRNRVGVVWADGGGIIDWEARDWLEVVSASR
mgnify:FL=1